MLHSRPSALLLLLCGVGCAAAAQVEHLSGFTCNQATSAGAPVPITPGQCLPVTFADFLVYRVTCTGPNPSDTFTYEEWNSHDHPDCSGEPLVKHVDYNGGCAASSIYLQWLRVDCRNSDTNSTNPGSGGSGVALPVTLQYTNVENCEGMPSAATPAELALTVNSQQCTSAPLLDNYLVYKVTCSGSGPTDTFTYEEWNSYDNPTCGSAFPVASHSGTNGGCVGSDSHLPWVRVTCLAAGTGTASNSGGTGVEPGTGATGGTTAAGTSTADGTSTAPPGASCTLPALSGPLAGYTNGTCLGSTLPSGGSCVLRGAGGVLAGLSITLYCDDGHISSSLDDVGGLTGFSFAAHLAYAPMTMGLLAAAASLLHRV